jgi:hypothetical protein
MPNKTNFASSTNAPEKFFSQCRLDLARVLPPEISCIGVFGGDWNERFICFLRAHSPSAVAARGAAHQFNQTIQLHNTERKGQSFADILWNGIFCDRLILNLTTSGAADTVGANCVAQGFSRGYTESRLRLSWSSCEHRQSDHPSPCYGMRKAKFARNGADEYFDENRTCAGRFKLPRDVLHRHDVDPV